MAEGVTDATVVLRNPTRWWWTFPLIVWIPATFYLIRDTTQTWPKLLAGSFYAIVIIAAVTAYRSRLVWSSLGVEARTRWRTYQLSWAEVGRFEVHRNAVCAILDSGRRIQLMRWATSNRRPAPDDVVAILEDLRQRFETDRT